MTDLALSLFLLQILGGWVAAMAFAITVLRLLAWAMAHADRKGRKP